MKTSKLISLLLIAVAFSFFTYRISAESTDSDKVSNLEDKIHEYERKLDNLQDRHNSLAAEIEYANNQISLTELRIENSRQKLAKKENDIQKLAKEIVDLGTRIDKLGESIKHQELVLNERLRSRYKTYETSPVVVLLGGVTVDRIIQKSEYLKIMELQDKKLITQMHNTKKAFTTQKTLVEDKKAEEEDLKQQILVEKANLDRYKVQLDDQKLQKQKLLQDTQNDEAKYQKLLDDAKKELNQMLNAVSVLKNTKSKQVERGELIGIQGNTGYSFGDHLHFGVYKYSSFEDIDGWNWYYSNYVDPSKVLKKKDVYWNTGCENSETRSVGKGDWSWPLKTPTISQGFGYTCYSSAYYGGKPHPAFDMYGPYGSPVYAAEEGQAYFCKNCLGDGANGVFIFHPGGYMSIYWHLR